MGPWTSSTDLVSGPSGCFQFFIVVSDRIPHLPRGPYHLLTRRMRKQAIMLQTIQPRPPWSMRPGRVLGWVEALLLLGYGFLGLLRVQKWSELH